MGTKSYNKFIRYSNLNEISKFVNFNNIYLLSQVKSISVWSSVDLSIEKSRLLYYSKGLLSVFLIYLITNKLPSIQSSKDQRLLYIESNLISLDLINFLEKFLIICNSKHRKNLVKKMKIKKKSVSFLITDFNFFIELLGFLNFFKLIERLHIDIHLNHDEDYRNLLFLDNLFKSSYCL